MALTPSIQLCLKSTCDELTFKETTGVYNASTNTGGYGAPNTAIGDITTAVLTVTDPDGEEYEINLFTEDFPSDDEDFEYTIDLGDLGSRTSIEDGYWQFSYAVSNGVTTYTANISYFFYCNAECCVNKLLAKISTCETCLDDKVNNKKISDYIKARAFLGALRNAATCFNEDAFDSILSLINKICTNSNCNTCN
jgi:hypothetical protein